MTTSKQNPPIPDIHQGPIDVPLGAISADALTGLIEAFILREGTDYGAVEATHEEKVEQIHRLLSQSQIKIIFDPQTESVTLVTWDEWRKAWEP